jgi:hypothetical protein
MQRSKNIRIANGQENPTETEWKIEEKEGKSVRDSRGRKG